MTPDLAYFKSNPATNFRVRDPRRGEVSELAALMLPAGVALEEPFLPPSPDTYWRVLAVRLPLRRVARVLTLEPAGKEKQPGFTLAPVALSGRMAVG